MARIAVFGLTADPVTSAHMEIISYLSGNYDKVVVVPTNVNYYKNYKGRDRAMFSFTERFDSLINKCSKYKNADVSSIEETIKEGWRFIDTLNVIIDQYGAENKYTVAMGSDSFQNFKTWYNYQEIYEKASLLVFRRPGYTDNFPEDIEYDFVEMNNDASSTKLRAKLLEFMEDRDFDEWIDDMTWGKEFFEGGDD